MTCEILVKPVAHGFVATVLGLTGCTVEAPTRDEAIDKARLEALSWLAGGEIVQVEIDLPQAQKFGVGIFADDETFDEFLAAMKAYREQVDSDPKIP